jgi:hypothetical protein
MAQIKKIRTPDDVLQGTRRWNKGDVKSNVVADSAQDVSASVFHGGGGSQHTAGTNGLDRALASTTKLPPSKHGTVATLNTQPVADQGSGLLPAK